MPRACMPSRRGAELEGRTLIAFGGGAPLHAARLAEKLGITRCADSRQRRRRLGRRLSARADCL